MFEDKRINKITVKPLRSNQSIRVVRDDITKTVGYRPPAKKTTMHSPTLGFPRIGNAEENKEAPKKIELAVNAPAQVRAPETHEDKQSSAVLSSKLRIIPLGGVEEIGKNMTVFEYQKDIIIVDVGLMFPDESMLGVDYAIPDVSYLEEKKQNIKGVLITHAHLDHIGALPYIIPKLGYPIIYALPLTRAFIEKRLEEFGQKGNVRIVTVGIDDVLRLGVFKIEIFKVNHNIPDGVGFAIHSPAGIVMHTGDFKFDYTPVADKKADISKIARIGGEGVLALMSDSTDAELPGNQVSEKDIYGVVEEIIKTAEGRVFAATFSSLVSRLQHFIWSAQKHGRKVTIIGRSMEENIEIARNLKYLEVPQGLIVENKEAARLPDDKVMVLLTGSQGEERSALNRISRGEHKIFSMKKGDTVVLSSSPIPGNERSITNMMDNLIRDGAHVIYKTILGVHAGGHGKQEDLKLMMSLVKPKYLIPIHGERHMLYAHAQLGISLGIPEENIFQMDNGQVAEFLPEGKGQLTKEKVSAGLVMVDGLGVGDVGNVVIRDRQKMAEDGMFVVIATVAENTGRLVTSPDIISRGFIYMRESTDIVEGARSMIKKMFAMGKGVKEHPASWDYMKTQVRDRLGEYLFEKTQRRPLVLPVIIEV